MSQKAEFEQAEMFLSHPFLNFLFKYSTEECFLNLFMLCEKKQEHHLVVGAVWHGDVLAIRDSHIQDTIRVSTTLVSTALQSIDCISENVRCNY